MASAAVIQDGDDNAQQSLMLKSCLQRTEKLKTFGSKEENCAKLAWLLLPPAASRRKSYWNFEANIHINALQQHCNVLCWLGHVT